MNQVKTAEQALIERMLSFNGCFDGYPTMTCYDEELVFAAQKEAETDNIPSYLAHLAAEHVKTKDQYERASEFYLAFMHTCWSANMSEGSNAVYERMIEE